LLEAVGVFVGNFVHDVDIDYRKVHFP